MCFKNYYGRDISKISAGVHGHIRIEGFIKYGLVGILDELPSVPDNN